MLPKSKCARIFIHSVDTPRLAERSRAQRGASDIGPNDASAFFPPMRESKRRGKFGWINTIKKDQLEDLRPNARIVTWSQSKRENSQEMKLHKTRFLIVMLWFQVSLHVTQAATTKKQTHAKDIQAGNQMADPPSRNFRHTRETVQLLTARKDGKIVPAIHEDGTYIWWGHTESKFKLEDNDTALVVPRQGLYLVNLKMYYMIPASYNCNKNLLLKTEIQQYHTSYNIWREVIKGEDTMQCVHHWHQSVTLSQVVRFEKGTKLRVVIEAKNYKFIVGDDSTYLNVTLL
ncbi:hypothetical protein Baya_0463 [Bagarius yarrelli]|uniref:THD domain-containing protein n=1 Tax=Bagarius yarrelli TaxID=175774 RepID=A0A556TIB8_BAGYA|nr:hypothetical protein Baya_0463 [Bagarius yarrelli]